MTTTLPNPIKAHLQIHSAEGPTERYDISITPFEGTHVLLRVLGPLPGQQKLQLQLWPNRWHTSISACAVLTLMEWFFGDVRPMPRIVGLPEWTQVSLELSSGRDGHMRRMMFWELRALSEHHAVLARGNGSKAPEEHAIALKPEDADGIFALLQHAMEPRHAHGREAAPIGEEVGDAFTATARFAEEHASAQAA